MKVLLSAVFCLIPAVAGADGSPAYEKTVDAVVSVIRPSPGGDSYCGTGVMVREDMVLTAGHVITGGPVEVVFAGRDHTGALIRRPSYYAGRGQPCRVVAVSHERDLALLRLVEPVDDVDVIRLATASAGPGEPVFSIGAGSRAALWRHASGVARQLYKGGFRAPGGVGIKGRILKTAIPLNHPGDAGSPILNHQAMLVGLTLASDPNDRRVSVGVDLSEVRQFLAEALAGEPPLPARRPAPPRAVETGGAYDFARAVQPVSSMGRSLAAVPFDTQPPQRRVIR
jgi:S1-C subfamily serine protease